MIIPFSLENAKDDSNFCIEKKSLDDLTIRCSQNLLTVIEKKKASVSDDKLAEHQKQLKEVIMRLESNDEMKSETETKKETKSIYAYCAADSIVQKEECKAINEVLAVLKQTNVPSILAARSVSSGKPPETTTPESWGGEGRH